MERGALLDVRESQTAAAPAAWLEGAARWVGRRIGKVTRIDERHARPWSRIARVETSEGVVWVKEVARELGFEPGLTLELSRTAPRLAPRVLATDRLRLATAHAGRRLPLRTDTLRRWEDVVAEYATLQRELAPIASSLPAPDARPASLARLGDDVAAVVGRLGDALPDTLVHLEVHGRHVFVQDGTPILVDWAEAVVGHPFCGLAATLREVVRTLGVRPGGAAVRRIRDAYLEPWRGLASPGELRQQLAAAQALGALSRALEIERLVVPLAPAARERWERKAARWRREFERLARLGV